MGPIFLAFLFWKKYGFPLLRTLDFVEQGGTAKAGCGHLQPGPLGAGPLRSASPETHGRRLHGRRLSVPAAGKRLARADPGPGARRELVPQGAEFVKFIQSCPFEVCLKLPFKK